MNIFFTRLPNLIFLPINFFKTLDYIYERKYMGICDYEVSYYLILACYKFLSQKN